MQKGIKLSEVSDDGGSSHQIIQVKESCRCASCGGTSETKLHLVLNERKLPVIGETKPWCLNLIPDSEISHFTLQLRFLT